MRKTVLAMGAGAIMTFAAAGAALAQSDKDFLTDAIKGDTSEVALGKLAEDKAHSEGVQAFGKMLVKDHGKAKIQAIMLARREGMSPPSDMKPDARKEMTELKSMSGNKFDNAFMDLMVKDHKKDIAMYRREAAKGDSKTAQLARKTLPTLEKHLTAAEKLGGS